MSNYNPYQGYQPYPNGYQPNINYQQTQQKLQQLQQQYGQQVPTQPRQQQTNVYAWVNGIEGAKAYLIAPGTSILLMDSDRQYLYIKTANEQGQASLKTYVISEAKSIDEQPKIDMSGYVKIDEFNQVKSQLASIEKMLTKKESK